jgi:hypothetical protein
VFEPHLKYFILKINKIIIRCLKPPLWGVIRKEVCGGVDVGYVWDK